MSDRAPLAEMTPNKGSILSDRVATEVARLADKQLNFGQFYDNSNCPKFSKEGQWLNREVKRSQVN